MKKTTTDRYTNRVVILTFAAIFVAGLGALGVVWMRHSIGTSASEVRMLETRLNEVDRSLARLNSEIASRTNPGFLQYQIDRFDLDLRRPTEEQIVRLSKPASLGTFAGREASTEDRTPSDVMAYYPERSPGAQ